VSVHAPRSRPRPSLAVVLPYEGRPELRLVAETAEDELALRAWLPFSSELRELPRSVLEFLDELDQAEPETAA
jgi:hypothetical protein